MAEIKVTTGQGVTQAIATNLGMSAAACKKVKLSVWQEVMSLVKSDNDKKVQNGGISNYSGNNDVSKIGDISNSNNFKVYDGQTMQIDDSIMGKIKSLLLGSRAPVSTPTIATPPITSTLSTEKTHPTTSTGAVAAPTSASSASEANIVANTPADGDFKTGSVAVNLFNKMLNANDVKISVISDDISALMSKKNPTPEDVKQIQKALSQGFKKLGGSMTQFISTKYGDGGETISKEAFMKFQNEGLSDVQIKEMETSNNNVFKRLDVDGDGVISAKEMSAFYYAIDFDDKNVGNGSIDSVSYYANMSILDDPNENIFDKKMAYTYNMLSKDEE